MPDYMFDGAFDKDKVDECKTAGAVAMSHYLTGQHAQTSAQPQDIRAAGMGAVLNYERAAGELVGASRAKGQEVARAALAGVDADCPRDGTVAIYFSVDVFVAGDRLSVCDEAFAGINDVVGDAFIVKTYGEGALIDHLVAKGLVEGKQWLSASSSFPGYNPHSNNVCLVQQVGAFVPGTDRNLITDTDAIGAWWPAGSVHNIGDDMSAAEVAAINKHTDDALSAFWATIGGDQKVDLTRLGNAVHAGPDGLAGTLAAMAAKVAALTALVQAAGGLTAAQAQQIADTAAAKAVDGITVTVHSD